ncbi:MAG: hypothetical protein DMF63_13710 [Acidobacteria bacterium]|nr:MAG: hypothetical protein DMF63_13710 [Acidobacteriota bacterium]
MRDRGAMKEKGQYLLAFGVVASMLFVVGFPPFVIFFFGIFAYFLLRMFTAGSKSETREIFEFYLSANEILRDDDRRWYAFEIYDCIRRGDEIVSRMKTAPPLVYFALGALQNKAGSHKAAISNLAHVIENPASDELAFVSPSPELQSYVRVLRKIEREPADAPLTSAAVRALERARKLRGKTLLEDSRVKFSAIPVVVEPQLALLSKENYDDGNDFAEHSASDHPKAAPIDVAFKENGSTNGRQAKNNSNEDQYVDRKTISEVLHDIYDKNVQ